MEPIEETPVLLVPIAENSSFAFTDEASVQLGFLILILGLLHMGRHHFRRKSSVSGKIHISEKRKTKIPSPSALPIIGVLHHLIGPDPFQIITDICNRYGKIVKGKILLKDFVLLNDPSYIQKMLSSTSPSHLNKPSFIYHAIVGGIVPNGLISSEHPVWKNHKKVIIRPLAIQHQIKKINFHIHKMISDLKIHANKNNNGVIDEGSLVFNFMNDMALEITLNIIMDMDVVSEEEKHEFHKNVLFNKRISGQRIVNPWLLINAIWRFHPLKKKLATTAAKIRKFVDHVYGIMCEDKHAKFPDHDQDGARLFKCIMGEMADAKFTNDDVFQEVLTMIAAGYETTTWTLSFLLMRLALNPEIQEKCRNEVDELFEKKELETNNKEEMSMHDVNSLEYLDRCLKESLRTTPAVPMFARRLDAPLILDDDITLPEGVNVALCPWATHRNPQVFPDPEKFDPDRFLPEEIAKRHPYAYFPFSGGMRNCPGSKIGPFVVKLAAARILRHFVVETKDTWESLKFEFEVSLAAEKEINFCLRKRHNIE